ncbi:MAG: succinylglutamate desuccinylase/aspartoacylase family protein, partial [Verrucomicrobiota bacterium]
MTNAQVEVLKPVCTLLVLWLLTQGATGQGVLVSGEEREQTTKRSGKIAPGTDWETDYHIIDSGVRGATVLIIGGMHGNEPAGSRVAEQIRHWPIVSGRMVVIPRANMLALEANTRLTPGQPEEDGNLNRNFPQTEVGEEFRTAPRGELAAALWGFAMKVRPDWTIDIHEGFDFHRSHNPSEGKKKSVGSSVIYQGSESMDALM